jgi:hypothetical protein
MESKISEPMNEMGVMMPCQSPDQNPAGLSTTHFDTSWWSAHPVTNKASSAKRVIDFFILFII